MRKRAHSALALVVATVAVAAPGAEALTLREYVNQVTGKDRGAQSAQREMEGMRLSVEGASLLTQPRLTAMYGMLDDKRPVNNTFQGDQIKNTTYSIGLEQQTPLGLRYALKREVGQTDLLLNGSITPVGPAITAADYDDVTTSLELSLPLWKNFLGREIRGERDNARFSAQAGVAQAEAADLKKESEIEETFYELANQQELLKINRESLARANRFLSLSEGRVEKNLAEKSELFQAQAAQSLRKLEIAQTEQKLAESARRFNKLRGVFSDQIEDELVVTEPNLGALAKLNRGQVRVNKELKALEAISSAKEADWINKREKMKPELDLVMKYATVDRDAETTAGTQKGKAMTYVGVSFKMPLNVLTMSDAKTGYNALAESQYLKALDAKDLQKNAWLQYVDAAESSVKQYQMLKDLEVLQKSKADSERQRWTVGRASTFQVLTFETDYLQARAKRLEVEFKIRQLINQLRQFEGS